MITLQSTKTILFHRETKAGRQEFRINPTLPGKVVEAPDWIRNDPYFKLHLEAGSLLEVQVKEQPKKPAKPATAKPGKSDDSEEDNSSGLK